MRLGHSKEFSESPIPHRLVIAVDPADLHEFAHKDNIKHLRVKAEDAVLEIEALLAGRPVGRICLCLDGCLTSENAG